MPDNPDTDVMAEVMRLIKQVMPDAPDQIPDPDTTFEELGLDSLTRVDLLAAVEAEFGVVVPDDEIGSFVMVRHLMEMITGSRVG